MPKIIAAIPVPPTEVYRDDVDYGSVHPTDVEPDLLVGAAITDDGDAYPIVLDDGHPTVLLNAGTTTELAHTEWHLNRSTGRTA